MKTVKEHNEARRKQRSVWRKQQIKKYGDDRMRAGVLCNVCHENGEDVEMVHTGKAFPIYPVQDVLECPKCGKQSGMER